MTQEEILKAMDAIGEKAMRGESVGSMSEPSGE